MSNFLQGRLRAAVDEEQGEAGRHVQALRGRARSKRKGRRIKSNKLSLAYFAQFCSPVAFTHVQMNTCYFMGLQKSYYIHFYC